MTREERDAHRTLIARLEAGDPLHQEAATEIRRLEKGIADQAREAARDARDAYNEGQWDERLTADERGCW